MIVTCEQCGKKYRIDPEKIKGKLARFHCRNCNRVITVSKADNEVPERAEIVREKVPPKSPGTFATAEIRVREKDADKEKGVESPSAHAKGLGVRGKMLLLFLVIPMVMMAVASALQLRQMSTLSSLIIEESADLIKQMAEGEIAANSRSVAMQVKLYLDSHPDLDKEDYNEDPGFKAVAVQKVGLTGYTTLYELPDAEGVWRTWAHADSKIVGMDMSALRKALGINFPGFWKIFTAVGEGKEPRGSYTWQDKDGRFREKYMVCTPVEGTSYVVSSSTYLDEFTEPVRKLEKRAKEMSITMRNTIVLILAGTLILIGFMVLIYSRRLTAKIRSLTDVTERISAGDLSAEVGVRSRDEIGNLAEAIGRMKESIRPSTERSARRK